MEPPAATPITKIHGSGPILALPGIHPGLCLGSVQAPPRLHLGSVLPPSWLQDLSSGIHNPHILQSSASLSQLSGMSWGVEISFFSDWRLCSQDLVYRIHHVEAIPKKQNQHLGRYSRLQRVVFLKKRLVVSLLGNFNIFGGFQEIWT